MNKVKCKLSELVEVKNGSTPSTARDDFYEGDIVWITPKDLSNNKSKYVYNSERRITKAGFDSCSTSLLPIGSVLLSSRAPIGLLAICAIETCTNQGFKNLVIKKNKINNEYLYYWLKTKVKYIDSLGTGTTFKEVSKGVIENLEIELPENINDQQNIASVLSALDSKIELNNRINAELEAMAKTLYDYWFVQFDFPDKNGKPYKTSGGKMVWNERLKREIPEEWQNLTLGEVVASTGTGLNPRDNFVLGEGNNFYVTIKNIEQGRVILDNKCDKISDQSLEIINKRSDLRIGDILFTSIEPVGITYLILEKPKNWNINESVFTIRPDYEKVTSEFLFMFLSGDYIKSYTKNVSAGSIHKGIRHSLLKDCQFILPERNTVDEFTLKVQPILKKLDLIQKENQKLIELRDWLLPMLMNGQVKVN